MPVTSKPSPKNVTTVEKKPLLPELSELKQGVPRYPHGKRTPSTVSGHATVLLLQDDGPRLAADALQPPFAAVEPQSHVPVFIPMHGIGGPARSEHSRASNTYQNIPPPTSSSDATSSAAACATEDRKSNRLPTHMPQPHAGAKQSVPMHIPIFSNGVARCCAVRSFPAACQQSALPPNLDASDPCTAVQLYDSAGPASFRSKFANITNQLPEYRLISCKILDVVTMSFANGLLCHTVRTMSWMRER